MEPFTRFYVEVFTESYDSAKNQKFLSHIATCQSACRFREYLSVVETTAPRALDSVGKTGGVKNAPKWAEVMVRAKRIRDGLEKGAAPFAVTREAVLEAAQEGYWLLIDEMNLAPPECLDAIVHAISHAPHPDFRLFACMNPATDAGRRRLPAGVRTRFTEFYVAETQDASQLLLVVSAYLPSLRAQQCSAVVDFYLNAKKMFPSYSLRTLCRALRFAAANMFVSEDRSLFEAISMAFLTNLGTADKARVRKLIAASFKCATNIAILPPVDGGEEQHVQVEGYWIRCGELLPQQDSHYVIRTWPRWRGSCVVEECLVQVVRKGHWVILDELNLAPTDVIEALNRLLDDNRDLFVPELNEAISAAVPSLRHAEPGRYASCSHSPSALTCCSIDGRHPPDLRDRSATCDASRHPCTTCCCRSRMKER